MLIPEFLADMRQLEPRVYYDPIAMARFDQLAQIFIGLGIALPVMPCCNVERADAGGFPTDGEITEVDAGAVGRIEEGPQALGSKWSFQAQIGENLWDVGETFVAMRAGGCGDPQYCAFRALETGHEWNALPTLRREDAGFFGNFEDRYFERLFPNDVQFRCANVFYAANDDVRFFGGVEAEGLGERGLSFEDDDCSAI